MVLRGDVAGGAEEGCINARSIWLQCGRLRVVYRRLRMQFGADEPVGDVNMLLLFFEGGMELEDVADFYVEIRKI